MAFSRAQATDPECAQAWLGQGLLALSLGENQEAGLLFEHAFEIADGAVPLARRLYAFQTLDQLESGRLSEDVVNLVQPLFALEQVRSQSAPDSAVDHLSALFHERAGHYETARDLLTSACVSAEQDYEESESVTALTRFAQGKADLGRVLLSLTDYDSAIESAETALQLAADDDEDGGQPSMVDPVARRKCRLSAHLTAGLASYRKGEMDDALGRFRSALEESEGSADVVCLLAQVLWAKGGQDERTITTEQLFECVNRASDHLQSILLLGVIATLNDQEETLDAVLGDLQGYRADNKFSPEQRQRIQEFLVTASSLAPSSSSTVGQTEDGISPALAETKTSIMLSPYASYGWTQLASLCEEDHFAYPAEMALKTAQRAVPPRGSLAPSMLAEAYSATGRVKDAQTAIVVAPWSRAGWNSFAEVLAS